MFSLEEDSRRRLLAGGNWNLPSDNVRRRNPQAFGGKAFYGLAWPTKRRSRLSTSHLSLFLALPAVARSTSRSHALCLLNRS